MARRRVEDVPFPVAEDWKRNERVMICLESSHIASQCSSTTVEECAFGCVFMATIGLLERKTTAATTTYVDPKTLLIGSRFPVTSQLRRTIKCRGLTTIEIPGQSFALCRFIGGVSFSHYSLNSQRPLD